MKLTKVFKTYVAAMLTSALLIGGTASVAKADTANDGIEPYGSDSFSVTLAKGTTVTVEHEVEKSVTDSDAIVSTSTKVPVNDEVSAYVVNAKGTIVSTSSAKFRAITSFTQKYVPYRDGKGVAGKKYKLKLSLSNSSLSNSITFKYNFIP